MNVRQKNQVRYKEAESPRFGATLILTEYRSNKCLSQRKTTDIVVLLEVTELAQENHVIKCFWVWTGWREMDLKV